MEFGKGIGVAVPEILIPDEKTNMRKWAVIACDQFTQNQQYWNDVERFVGSSPSALHVMLPEIYLDTPEKAERIASAKEIMRSYIEDGVLNLLPPGFILVERYIDGVVRKGLMVNVDLEEYENEPYKNPVVRPLSLIHILASTVNEILLTKHLLRTVKDAKLKKYILNHYIDQFRTTVLRQTMFAEFEMLAHEMAERGEPLTVQSLCETYGKLNALYHGPDMGEDETISYEWARIPHFYNAFYVYKYATGFSCACAIVHKLEEEPGMLEKYKAFLSGGGSDYPMELLRKAGIEVGEAVEICMKEFAQALEEFEALA